MITPRQTVSNHPNASLATATGSVSTLLAWLFDWAGVPINATTGAALSTVLVALALFIGRRGIKGIISTIWKGSE